MLSFTHHIFIIFVFIAIESNQGESQLELVGAVVCALFIYVENIMYRTLG